MSLADHKMLLLKREPKTRQIETIERMSSRLWCVTFKGSNKQFCYSDDNVKWLATARRLQSGNCKVYKNGREVLGVAEILQFEDAGTSYWRIRYQSGTEAEYVDGQIRVSCSCLVNASASNVFSYMCDVAANNRLGADDEGKAILESMYERIDFVDDKTSAACYLNPDECRSKCLRHKNLIYPFGCNASQKIAVAKAFEHQISVVKGPPGTGKTQTILNIIANIVRQGKTVMVVSNNNSATLNVQEKLQKYGVSFIVAPLGSHDNKVGFLANQPSLPQELAGWSLPIADSLKASGILSETLSQLDKVYALQNRLAELRQEQQTVNLEWAHFCKNHNISDGGNHYRMANTANVIWLWLKLQSIADGVDVEQQSTMQRIKLWWTKLLCKYKWHIHSRLDTSDLQPVITELQTLYYVNRRREIAAEIADKEGQLQLYNATTLTKSLTDCSWQLFKDSLYKKYKVGRTRWADLKDLRCDGENFLKQYPVVLSTTFSAKSCVFGEKPYDYLIMDEASQVSVETGLLALCCAYNVVIVGDDKQLPNVVTAEDKQRLTAIMEKYDIAESYNGARYSFLQSVCATIPDVPQTFLREHYRCHPRIINFCNQMFYRGNLIIMTEDKGEDDVLLAVRTAKGNHAINHYNQREIDVVREEILPRLKNMDDIGIVTPYNNQVDAFNRQLKPNMAGTVHKYQGRENDVIIMSVVDNQISDFADDSNMLNVAVSRAKKKFCLVVSGNEQEHRGNIQSLIDYMAYNNCIVTDSKVASIFDYLYAQYTEQRMKFAETSEKVSEYSSENLTYALLNDVLDSDEKFSHFHVVCHMPLRMLIQDSSLLTEQEITYAGNYSTHIDFLIVDNVTHKPVLAIETDGYSFHNEATRQHQRDELKNNILSKYGLPLLRLSTKGSGERERVTAELLKQV